MKTAFRVLRRVLTASAAFAAVGLGTWQLASAQAPGIAGPAVGPAIAGPGPAVAPAPIGPIVDGPIVDAPPPGPALQNHFVHIERWPGFQRQVEFRTELMLFADGSFSMITPAIPDFGDGLCDRNCGPTRLLGTWGVQGNRVIMQFNDGFEDWGFVSIGNAGPVLRFAGRRWTDLLAIPAPAPGPIGPAIGAAPVGPAAGPGPAVAGPAAAGPVVAGPGPVAP